MHSGGFISVTWEAGWQAEVSLASHCSYYTCFSRNTQEKMLARCYFPVPSFATSHLVN